MLPCLATATALVATLIPIPPGAAVSPPAAPDTCPCRAVAPPPSPVPPPIDAVPAARPGTHWYGLPAIAIDGLALTLAAGGVAAEAEGPFLLGTMGYFLGAPFNHLVHRRYGAAAGSLLLRGLASGAAFAIFIGAYPSEHCDGDIYQDHPCQHETALVLGGLVLATAAIIDDVWLARAAPPPASRAGASLTPGLLLTPKLGMLSLGGSF